MLLALFITRIDAYGGTRRIYKSNVRARKRSIPRPDVKADLSARPLLNSIVFPSRLVSPGRTEAYTYSLQARVKYSNYSPAIIRPERDPTPSQKPRRFCIEIQAISETTRAPLRQLDNLERQHGFCELRPIAQMRTLRELMPASSSASLTYLRGRQCERKSCRENERMGDREGGAGRGEAAATSGH